MTQSGRRVFLKEGAFSFAGMSLWGSAAKGLETLPTPEAASNAPPFHLGLVTYNLARDWDVPTIIQNCEATGFEGVELRTTHKHGVELSLTKPQRAEVRQRFANSKVRLASLGSTCEFESPDAATVNKNIEETKHWCELARDLGCLGVKVRPNGFPRGIPHDQTLDQIGHALAKCGDAARDQGVEIWLEVHGEETEKVPNIHRILSVANHPSVGACWNSNPTNVESGSVEKSFNMLKQWIRSCHINDLDRKEYPWHQLFGLLRGINFHNYTFAEVGEPSCEPIRFMNYYHALWDYCTGEGRP